MGKIGIVSENGATYEAMSHGHSVYMGSMQISVDTDFADATVDLGLCSLHVVDEAKREIAFSFVGCTQGENGTFSAVDIADADGRSILSARKDTE